MNDKKIVFYGAGSMAEAIARGILAQDLVSNKNVAMLNRANKERLQELHVLYGVQTELQGVSNQDYIEQADIIFLAMKPKDAAMAIAAIKPYINKNQLIISVIAGLSINGLERLLGEGLAIVRTMPNTSSTIGFGVTGISYSPHVSEEQRFIVEQLYSATGITVVIEEDKQDAITSVSGSGPAYIYFVMEQMIQGALRAGFSAEDAKKLVAQTALGAAQMVVQTGEEPAELRRKVSSPNGTTEAAIKTMTEKGLPEAILAGMARCEARAKEIGQAVEEGIK